MIVFDLSCDHGHTFEGWFGSSGDFASQRERGLLACPQCGSAEVSKAPMAPAVPRKGNQRAETPASTPAVSGGDHTPVASGTLPPAMREAIRKLAEAQARALKNSQWVGRQFAEKSRAMHYGESEHQPIHGEASLEEARLLIDEGIEIAPLPFPVAPPEDLN